MSKPTHHIVLLLDRSGSMASWTRQTMAGVNEFAATAKNVQKQTGANIKLTCFGFESSPELMKSFDGIPVQKCPKFTDKEIYGSGGTQMYDGYAFVFKHFKDKLKKGDTFLLATFTDGQTGGDNHTAKQIKTCIDDWHSDNETFVYVCPTGNADSASLIGIPDSNVMEYEVTSGGFRSAFWKLSRGLRKYLETVTGDDYADAIQRVGGFFDGIEVKNSVMKVNGLEVTMNMPECLNEKDRIEGELPPYAPVSAHVVDEYPSCPSNWMNGSAKASSYFVGIKPDHGMWLDFNKLYENEHDVAVVISVQGVNPITGQKTSALRLEKYENKCPVHDKEFGQERFCKECGYKWPSQNYIATNATPNGTFWLDGFRASDGKVRQYVFTEDQAKGVAKAIIGDDRVFAIGIAFYLSKAKKPKPAADLYGGPLRAFRIINVSKFTGLCAITPKGFYSPLHTKQKWNSSGGGSMSAGTPAVNFAASAGAGEVKCCASLGDAPSAPALYSSDEIAVQDFSGPDIADGRIDQTLYQLAPKTYEIGAGAKLEQDIYSDPQKIDYWQEEPIGMVYITYSDTETVAKILSNGKRTEVEEGFLANVPVAN